jgi:thiol-disulfide isomerase/thioredoxin
LPSTPSSPDARPSRTRYVALAIVCALIAGVAVAVILVTKGDGGSSAAASCVLPPPTGGPTAQAEINGQAPDFTLCSVDGKPVSLSQFRGKPVVLTFFASWCQPCRAELPMMEKLQKEMGDRLQVVAVNYRDIDFDSKRFVRDMGVTYPALLESDDNPVAERYGVHGIPMTFFIDSNGKIAYQTLFGEGSRTAIQPGLDKITG